jgi:hypothetical protein
LVSGGWTFAARWAVRMAAIARSMLDGENGRPVFGRTAVFRWVTYSMSVSGAAGIGALPVAAHHPANCSQSEA